MCGRAAHDHQGVLDPDLPPAEGDHPREDRAGEFKPGERIPTEYELCERFSISRTSVRQALAELTQEGYLYRQQGSGTFVSSQEEAAVTVRVLLPEVHWVPSSVGRPTSHPPRVGRGSSWT